MADKVLFSPEDIEVGYSKGGLFTADDIAGDATLLEEKTLFTADDIEVVPSPKTTDINDSEEYDPSFYEQVSSALTTMKKKHPFITSAATTALYPWAATAFILPELKEAKTTRRIPEEEKYPYKSTILEKAEKAVDVVGNPMRTAIARYLETKQKSKREAGLDEEVGMIPDIIKSPWATVKANLEGLYAAGTSLGDTVLGDAKTSPRRVRQLLLKEYLGKAVEFGKDDFSYQYNDAVDLVADIGVDIGLDPLTYASLGVSGFLKLLGKSSGYITKSSKVAKLFMDKLPKSYTSARKTYDIVSKGAKGGAEVINDIPMETVRDINKAKIKLRDAKSLDELRTGMDELGHGKDRFNKHIRHAKEKGMDIYEYMRGRGITPENVVKNYAKKTHNISDDALVAIDRFGPDMINQAKNYDQINRYAIKPGLGGLLGAGAANEWDEDDAFVDNLMKVGTGIISGAALGYGIPKLGQSFKYGKLGKALDGAVDGAMKRWGTKIEIKDIDGIAKRQAAEIMDSYKGLGMTQKEYKQRFDKHRSDIAKELEALKDMGYSTAHDITYNSVLKTVSRVRQYIRHSRDDIFKANELTSSEKVQVLDVMGELKSRQVDVRKKLLEGRGIPHNVPRSKLLGKYKPLFDRATSDAEAIVLNRDFPVMLEKLTDNVSKSIKQMRKANHKFIEKMNKETGSNLRGLGFHIDDVYKFDDGLEYTKSMKETEEAFEQMFEAMVTPKKLYNHMAKGTGKEAETAVKFFGQPTEREIATIDELVKAGKHGEAQLIKDKAKLRGYEKSHEIYTRRMAFKFLNQEERRAFKLMSMWNKVKRVPFHKQTGFEQAVSIYDLMLSHVKTMLLLPSLTWYKNNYYEGVVKAYTETGISSLFAKGADEKAIFKYASPNRIVGSPIDSKNLREVIDEGVVDTNVFRSSMQDQIKIYDEYLSEKQLNNIGLITDLEMNDILGMIAKKKGARAATREEVESLLGEPLNLINGKNITPDEGNYYLVDMMAKKLNKVYGLGIDKVKKMLERTYTIPGGINPKAVPASTLFYQKLYKNQQAIQSFFAEKLHLGQMGEYIENKFRAHTYMAMKKDLVKQGIPDIIMKSASVTKAEADDMIKKIAADMVKRAFFDYKHVKVFEKAMMKRLFPFYTFHSRNIGYWADALTDPAKIGRAKGTFRVKTALGRTPSEEERATLPRYQRARAPRIIGPGGRGLRLGYFASMPVEELFKSLDISELVAKMSPIIKLVGETISGEDFFTGMPLLPRDLRSRADRLRGKAGKKRLPSATAAKMLALEWVLDKSGISPDVVGLDTNRYGDIVTSSDTLVWMEKFQTQVALPFPVFDQVARLILRYIEGKSEPVDIGVTLATPLGVSDVSRRTIKRERTKSKSAYE